MPSFRRERRPDALARRRARSTSSSLSLDRSVRRRGGSQQLKRVPTAVERNRPAFQTAGMAKKPEPPKPISWSIYKIAAKRTWVGEVEATDERKAIEKAATEFRYHVALPAEKVRDPVNREVIFCAAGVLSTVPLTYFMRQDDSDLVVFCFAEPEDAEAFAERFGGKRLPGRRR
jgi:hypothetical protein